MFYRIKVTSHVCQTTYAASMKFDTARSGYHSSKHRLSTRVQNVISAMAIIHISPHIISTTTRFDYDAVVSMASETMFSSLPPDL